MLLDSASDVGNRVSSGGRTQLHGPWQLHTDQSAPKNHLSFDKIFNVTLFYKLMW